MLSHSKLRRNFYLKTMFSGPASDKFITKDSGFYDLERDNIVMSGCGFLIEKGLLLPFCNLEVPLCSWEKNYIAKNRFKGKMKFTNSY